MTPRRRIFVLHKNFTYSISRFTKSVHPIVTSPRNEKEFSHSLINLSSSWANFLRAYVLSSIMGAKLGKNKITTNAGFVNDINTALGIAIKQIKPNATPRADGSWNDFDEPNWLISNQIIKIATKLNFSNLTNISATFSTGSNSYDTLRIFRNYYAHRNRDLQRKVSNQCLIISMPSNLTVTEALASPTSNGTILFHKIIDDLYIASKMLCH
ncbi:hypothetical protein [Chromobacterium vaccinii]|uniref:hypothetical protein n=1 Tax=Chromobacterium vaccinii TaxID=1108595 RepID=UPI000B213372|nr:hypothetical protein [Chromobacterium vaccinii]